MEEKDKILCLKCKYYFSTYDPALPRGCKLYQFRSATIPSIVVKRETGKECLGFEERKKPNEKINFMDKKYW